MTYFDDIILIHFGARICHEECWAINFVQEYYYYCKTVIG